MAEGAPGMSGSVRRPGCSRGGRGSILRRRGGDMEDEPLPAQAQNVAIAQNDFLDRLAVDLGAVGAAEVAENIAAMTLFHLGVMARDTDAFDDQVVVEGAAQGKPWPAHRHFTGA